MKRTRPWWIKRRYNPQLGIYYVAMGQMSKTEAKRHETETLYGSNEMLCCDSEDTYKARLFDLKKEGNRVHL